MRTEADASADRLSEEGFRQQVRTHLRRNYLAHLGHGLLGQTGFRLIEAPTLLPAYVFGLSGSNAAVGIARGLQGLGLCLTPFLGATAVDHRRRVLPVGLVVGALMRLQILGIALAGFFLAPRANLVAICVLLGLFGFFLGMQRVIFSVLVAKVIPVERRGTLVGLRNFLAGFTASAVGLFGGYLIATDALGNGYAATFGVAFLSTSLGLSMLLLVREPESPQVREKARVRERVRELPALLRADRSFTHYAAARALATMGRMAVPYYVIYADQTIGLSGAQLGWLTGAFVLAQTSFNLVWGLAADRRGFRAIFIAALSLWILSVLVLLQIQSFGSLLMVFAGLGAGLGGFMLASQNLVLEFGSRQRLPLRIAATNSSSELSGAVGVLVGGLLADSVSYLPVFWIAIVLKSAALAMVLLRVDEPRRRPPAPGTRTGGAGQSP